MRSATMFAATAALVSTTTAQVAGFAPVTSPKANEMVEAGSPFTIEWQPGSYKGAVTISLIGGKTQGTQVPLKTLVANQDITTGSYAWNVDCSLGKDAVYGLSVVSNADANLMQYSNPFHIDDSNCGAEGGDEGEEEYPKPSTTGGEYPTGGPSTTGGEYPTVAPPTTSAYPTATPPPTITSSTPPPSSSTYPTVTPSSNTTLVYPTTSHGGNSTATFHTSTKTTSTPTTSLEVPTTTSESDEPTGTAPGGGQQSETPTPSGPPDSAAPAVSAGFFLPILAAAAAALAL